MVVKCKTTCAISCKFESHSWRGVLDSTLCDQVCQYLVAGRWFSPGTPVSSTNKTDHHDIAEIFLTVALNTIAAFNIGILRWSYTKYLYQREP
jgi:hypothetical protein